MIKPVPSMKLGRFFPSRPETPAPTDIPRPTTPHNTSAEFNYAVETPWITEAERIGYSYLMPLVCIAGVIFNCLVILVLTRKIFKAPTYTYLIALAAADVCTALFTLPIGAVRCGPCLPENNGYGRLFYEIFIYVPLTNTSENVSSWMTVVLALDRTLTLKKPLHERALLKNRYKAFLIIACVVFGAVVLNLPYFFAMDIIYSNGEYLCYFAGFGDSHGFGVFSWLRALFVQFIPLILLLCVNFHLLMQVRKSEKRCSRMSVSSRSVARERAQIRLTLMLVGTIVLFILGHVPIAFAYTVIFQAVFGEELAGGRLYANLRVTTHLIAMTSYTLDFLVYCLVNRFFREATIGLFTCHRHKRRVMHSSSESSSPMDKKSNEATDCSAKTNQTTLIKY